MGLKVCITGAGGLIGKYISEYWQAQGHQIYWLVRSLPKATPPGIQIKLGDITDPVAIVQAFETMDVVIHCAAIVSFGNTSEQLLYKINVEGTANVVNACLSQSKAPKLIYMSSVAAIGRNTDAVSVTEETPWSVNKLTSLYAKTKYAAEIEVWRGVAEGLEAIILNPSVVCGVSDWTRSSTLLFKNVYDGLLFYPKGSINIVDARDIARATLDLFMHQKFNDRFILSGHKLTYYTFFSAIAEVFGKPKPRYAADPKWLLPLYYLSKPLLFFWFKKKMLNAETIRISASDLYFDGSKICKTVPDFHYTAWQQTIQEVCDGLKMKYRL